MSQRKIYLHLQGDAHDEVIAFLKAYDELSIKKLSQTAYELDYSEEIDSEFLESAREFSLVELYQDLTIFVAPKDSPFSLSEIQSILKELNPRIYTIETMIPELVFLGRQDLIKTLRNHYYGRFNVETIDTILGFINCNLNGTKTSKALFMHRNTLNYRLDNFIAKTEIDVRTFTGALAIYLLFRR